MPIYEYRCTACGRKSSRFFRSVAVVEENPKCPLCGRPSLQRMMSSVWAHRSKSSGGLPEPTFEMDDVPFYGPDAYDDMSDPGGWKSDEESVGDLAAMVQEARAMARMSGEALDPAFDQALDAIEQGAVPEDVFGELDAEVDAPSELPTSDDV